MSFNDDFIFPVYIYENILVQIEEFSKNSKKEIFGYLIGNILKWKEIIYIIIKDQIFIKGAIHSHQFSTSQIEGTAGEYEKQFQNLKIKKQDDNLRIEEFFFPESYQVALVVDPIREEFKFFTLEKVSEKKYKSINNAIISPK
jgi:hypothetical protein